MFDTNNYALVGTTRKFTKVTVSPGQSMTLLLRVERAGEPVGFGYSHDDLEIK